MGESDQVVVHGRVAGEHDGAGRSVETVGEGRHSAAVTYRYGGDPDDSVVEDDDGNLSYALSPCRHGDVGRSPMWSAWRWVKNTASRREKSSPAFAKADGDPRPQSMTKTRSSTMTADEIPARPATGMGVEGGKRGTLPEVR